MTLTNIQIDNLAIKYKIPNFKCIMNNELNGIPKRDCNIIINLENDNLSGSHWCAIIVKNKQKIYGDSFACVPSLEVANFLNNNFMYNEKIIQSLTSNNCGLFALGLIIYCNMHKGDLYKSANEYYNLFNPVNLKQNDNIIKTLFATKFG